MKKTLLLFVAVIGMMGARADEGMWIPMLIGKNYDEMQRLGLKLTKEDLYSINHSSMKDAILQFGGGCTAEMISSNGLLLTNHHCGYDAIAALSTVDRNLLDNGFWAHSLREEMPAQGVTALFLQRMEDVTNEVKMAVNGTTGAEYTKAFDAVRKTIEEREGKKGKYVANVKEYFNGNQYFLLIYKRYTDVRLVGNPPRSLGKYGGDIDNWMWPRHTADFSMFRIYADSNNNPKPYAASNVPYHPGKYLPVSIKGQKEGDYAMIMGYPGRTNRYEVSYGVDMAINTVNPSIVAIRDLRLNIMKKHMDADKKTYLQLTGLYSKIANYWKYFIGQTEQLKRLNVVEKKRKSEDKFTTWARATQGMDAGLMSKFELAFDDYKPYAKHATYYGECFRASALSRMAVALKPLYDYYEKNPKTDADSVKKYITGAQAAYRAAAHDYEKATDMDLFAQMTKMFYENVDKTQMPDIYTNVIFNKACVGNKNCAKPKKGELACFTGTTYDAYAAYVYNNTFLTDSVSFNKFCAAPTFAALKNDAAVLYAYSFANNYKKYAPKVEAFTYRKAELAKEYLREMMIWKDDKMFYPDANSTMRITYGSVLGYEPQDGVHYNYFTTMDGLMAKYKAGDEDFDVPADLVNLYKAKDYGMYADADGKLHTCFITNNDITGGNSGSPCINGNGELVGAAFDGNWEAMSGDIAFDRKYKRTIVCDIRYILFLIDKMGHADNLIKEMDIRK